LTAGWIGWASLGRNGLAATAPRATLCKVLIVRLLRARITLTLFALAKLDEIFWLGHLGLRPAESRIEQESAVSGLGE
jgi:hypothetical protein